MPPVQPDVIKVVRIATQGPPGSAGNVRLANLADVDVTTLVNGSILIYDTTINKFRATTTIEQNQIINGGYF